VILIVRGGLGLITPPVGSVLYVGTDIGKISVGVTLRTFWPFYLTVLVVLRVVAFVPALSLCCRRCSDHSLAPASNPPGRSPDDGVDKFSFTSGAARTAACINRR
jgi:hypothetical protein